MPGGSGCRSLRTPGRSRRWLRIPAAPRHAEITQEVDHAVISGWSPDQRAVRESPSPTTDWSGDQRFSVQAPTLRFAARPPAGVASDVAPPIGGLAGFPQPARRRASQWRHAVRTLDPEGRLRIHEVRSLTGYSGGRIVARLLREHWVLRATGPRSETHQLDAQSRLLVPLGVRHHLGLDGPLVVSLATDGSRIAIWPSARLDVVMEDME